MTTFLQIAQSLTVALKALQMYTETHPRAQESLALAQSILTRWVAEKGRLQFVTTGAKAFVDGQPEDTRPPQVATLVKLVGERAVSGFSVDPGLSQAELLAFLQALALKPQRLAEEGGFDAFLKRAGVRCLQVSQTRYQEISEGELAGKGEAVAPLFNPAPPTKTPSSATPAPTAQPNAPASPEALLKLLQAAALATWSRDLGSAGSGVGGGPGGASLRGGNGSLGGSGGLGRDQGLGSAGSGVGGGPGGASLRGGSEGLGGSGGLGRDQGLGSAGSGVGGGPGGASLRGGNEGPGGPGGSGDLGRDQDLGSAGSGVGGGPGGASLRTGTEAPGDLGWELGLGAGSPGAGDDEGILGFLKRVSPADLSGLGPLGTELGLGTGMPTPAQLGTLRQLLLGLSTEAQLNLLAGLGSIPGHPAGLGLGMKALAGEVLAAATGSALSMGASWTQLRGPVQGILRSQTNREPMVRALAARLHAAGLDGSQAEQLLRQLDWEDLSLEAKLVKILEGGQLFELSLEQRLALLRELLDTRRFNDLLRVQDMLIHLLSHEQPAFRMKAIQTLTGVARWAQDPGLPPEGEGPLAEALRAHFAWEPDPPIHRWTTEALEAMVTAQVLRGEFRHILADLQELQDLTAFLEEQQPWRNEGLAQLRMALTRPLLMDVVVDHIFSMDRERVLEEINPYMEFLGDPMARHLLARLENESDRAHRGRLVDAARSLGALALPALMSALTATAWYLVRNALTVLSDLGDAGCVPAIVPLLRHPDPRVRRTAVRALWKLGGPVAEPHLLARMKDTDTETMQEILFALGQLRSETSLAPVCELAQDKRVAERIRVQALDTLGHIASPRALPTLLECLRRKSFFGGGETPAIRLAAAKALAAINTPEAHATFKKLLDTEPKGEELDALLRLRDHPGQP